MYRKPVLALFSCALLGVASNAVAGPILTRAALDAFLGGNAVAETFEGFTVADGTATSLGTLSFDSTSTLVGQGPGLIAPGLTVSTPSGSLLWQGAGFYSLPTRTMGTDPASDLRFDFQGGISAFGMDLLNYGGFPATSQVTVYGSDDVTVLATVGGLSFPAAVTPIFFGYEFVGGIGSVRVLQTAGFGPVVDNVTFGSVPEPASLTLLGTGLVALALRGWRSRRREN